MILIPLYLLLGPKPALIIAPVFTVLFLLFGTDALVIVAVFAAIYLAGKFSLWSDPSMPERSRRARDRWPHS